MTRRTEHSPKPIVQASGGSKLVPPSSSAATRRANDAARPTAGSPGGSMLAPDPQGLSTRRATPTPPPIADAPGGSVVVAEPGELPTRPGGPSLLDLIREADTDPQVSDADLARGVLETLRATGQVGVLLPILTDEVRRLRRRHVRTVERQAFASQANGESADGGWLRLLAEHFTTPDGRVVTWGAATVEDHEARIEWLNGQIHALGQDVDRHEQAIKLIREHGAACLAEIEAAA